MQPAACEGVWGELGEGKGDAAQPLFGQKRRLVDCWSWGCALACGLQGGAPDSGNEHPRSQAGNARREGAAADMPGAARSVQG